MLRLITVLLAGALVLGARNLTIGTLNLAMVTDADRIVADVRKSPPLRDADVLLFQEVVQDSQQAVNVAQVVAAKMERHIIFASPDGARTRSGLAILSRYPLLDQRVYKLQPQNLVFRSRARIALSATVVTEEGPVRIVNVHLDTRINPAERIAQLQPALNDTSCFYGPAVIAGDFNTNDMEWVSNVVPLPHRGWQAARVRILMESRGYQTPFQQRRATFNHLGMQLDWIYSAGLEATAHGIELIAFSDHRAVWTTLAIPASGSSSGTKRSRAARQGGA